MSDRYDGRRLALAYVAAIAVCLVALAVAGIVMAADESRREQAQRMDALNTLSTIRANLEGKLNGAILVAQGLVALVKIRPDVTADEFEKMARELMAREKRIRNIGLGFGTVVKYVYPLKGNEAAVGLDYLKRPDQRAAVVRMIETGETVVAGPVPLVQGGVGIISRTPIFLPSPDGKGTVYKGVVSIPMDLDGLFEDAGLHRRDLPIDIAIRGKDGQGDQGDVFFGDARLFDGNPVMLDVQLPAGSWRMAAVTKPDWYGRPDRVWIIGSLGSLLSLVLGGMTFVALRAHLRLEASERQFRSAIDDAPIPIMLHGGGNVVMVNRAWTELSGYARTDIPTVSAWITKAHPGRRTAPEADRLWQGERTIRTAARDSRVWDFSSHAVAASQGDSLVVSMAVDVTDRKLAEIELRRHRDAAEQANIAKSAFLANMSHELRTPLTAIIGFSEMIYEEMLGPGAAGRYREYAADIISSGRHLLSVINDLLDVSKIEAGKLEIAPEWLDLPSLVAAVVRLNRDAAARKEIRITTALDDDVGSLWGDERAARQILINLLSNAIKFTPECGSITVAVSTAADGGVEISVADDGIGIPAERLPKLMQPFEQVDNRYARAFGGSGLGLALVKGLAERHGGGVTIHSVVGKGTVVIVRFPPHYAHSGAIPHETSRLSAPQLQTLG